MASQERETNRQPFKACPWWARIAIRPDGLIMAHCSYEEAKKQNTGWDNPPKARECFLGFTKTEAKRIPAIIIYDPETEEYDIVEGPETNLLTEVVWGKLVATFNTFPEKLFVGPKRLVNELTKILCDRGEEVSTGISNQNEPLTIF